MKNLKFDLCDEKATLPWPVCAFKKPSNNNCVMPENRQEWPTLNIVLFLILGNSKDIAGKCETVMIVLESCEMSHHWRALMYPALGDQVLVAIALG